MGLTLGAKAIKETNREDSSELLRKGPEDLLGPSPDPWEPGDCGALHPRILHELAYEKRVTRMVAGQVVANTWVPMGSENSETCVRVTL